MSIQKMNAVQGRRKDLDPGSCHARVERLVLMNLADNANDDGFCWPSLAELAWKSGCDERSVRRILHKFEESGEVHILYRGNGPKDPNWYLVCLDMTEEQIIEALIKYFKYDKEESAKLAAEILEKLANRTWDFGPQKEYDFANKGDSVSDKGDTESPKPSRTIMKEEDEDKGDTESPLADDGPTYIPLDENGDETEDPPKEALLNRVWRATINSATRGDTPKLTQKEQRSWNKLYEMVQADDRYAQFIEHQIAWSRNEDENGVPHHRIGFKKFLELALSDTIFKKWLEEPEYEGFDPTEVEAKPRGKKKRDSKPDESDFEQEDFF